ncbi:MAG: glycosyltransferase [Lachnospiraceae bacterium]|nr:glycosyltransferase [Lachnospiraceae bacterium]
MKLSVIVPVYNMAAGNRLVFCLDSLMAQSVKDMEVIAVDDASTDESPQILKAYEQKYPDRFRAVYCDVNHRQGGAKNRGLKEARGEWVGFTDSDDFLAPDMYEKLLAKAEETGADIVGCDYSIVDKQSFETGKRVVNNSSDQTGMLDEEKHKSHILNSGSMVVKIYLRSVIEDNALAFPEGIFYEDNCAAPLWSLYFKHFERVDEALYYYLQIPDSTTHHVSFEKCEDRMKAMEQLLSECERRGFSEKYGAEIRMRVAELGYVNTLFSYMYDGRPRKLKDCAEIKDYILRLYPEFRENPYYMERVNPEYRKFIDLQMKSDVLFFVYYILLYGYRNVRKRLSGQKPSE